MFTSGGVRFHTAVVLLNRVKLPVSYLFTVSPDVVGIIASYNFVVYFRVYIQYVYVRLTTLV